MQKQDFHNTDVFAETIARWRGRDGLNLTRQQIAEAGGPSDTTQSWIEQARQEQPVTDATVNKYRIAFDALGSKYFHSSYLSALADAHRYHQACDPAGDGVEHAANEWTDPDNIYLGVDLGGDDWPVTATTLINYAAEPASALLRQRAAGDENEFQRLAIRLAELHPTVVLLPSSHTGSGEFARIADGYWLPDTPSPVRLIGQVASRLYRGAAFDPIAGPTSLTAARDRAVALGAQGDDSITLGWAILLANMLARYLDSTAIEAWIANADNDAIWKEAIAALPSEVACHVPDLRSALSVGHNYLRGWAGEYTLSHLDIEFGSESRRGHLDWHTSPSKETVNPYRLEKGELWIYNDKQLPTLPNVLLSRWVNNIVLQPDRIIVNTQFRPRQYSWLPTGLKDSKTCLLRDEHGTWRAVRTP